ncbi:Polypeptide N-acetylgalactosaminyltransferase 6 (Polypeptide GalNAc transferase 6) (GalNAc-T6) (pp-GaNTase 6) (Protein-UDP acetylgalactosaminyltransferase 6) (UDP-GalNAc:polypeptide N-acetylgalactosaminyltransferase 6) [Durusdinium trenchii]|uniref:Protein-UDP acetylgalactosaminyltransferase 7 n=1 Tax=Durusdinium trenchii TaxID=1381693 RepID=A0ABP0QM42_9DINO
MARHRRQCCGCGYVLTISVFVVSLGLTALAANLYFLHPDRRGVRGAHAGREAPAREVEAAKDQLAPKQVVELPVVVPKVGAGAEAGGARAVTGEDDNAPRPAPRPGDSEFEATPGLKERPGAGPGHWHGKLGLGADGTPLIKPTPLPSNSETMDFKQKAHMGQCYNAAKSDSVPLDRDAPDTRPEVCKLRHRNYPKDLRTASIVIVFHNEVASVLLRSVHSVLNQSPQDLLHEVILVDDASVPDPGRFTEERWQRLQKPLLEYVLQLPKVRLVRLGERRGLMLARMEGAWRARAEIVVFLDSHIEATPGWLEPLLARIHEDRRHVVVPNILGIHFDNLGYEGSSGLGVLSFTWTLGQRPMPTNTGSEIQKSSIMAGGLFAADKAFFMHLGGYDPEMRFYGGEEMEIGFRTWQCGGDIEYVPCSRVYHIFRTSRYWQGTDSAGVAYKVPGVEIVRNKLRAAAVWMDEYEVLVQYASAPLPTGVTLGDLESRKSLRQHLQCKSFKWYLENVAKEVFVPSIEGLLAGSLRNIKLDACIDTLGGHRQGLLTPGIDPAVRSTGPATCMANRTAMVAPAWSGKEAYGDLQQLHNQKLKSTRGPNNSWTGEKKSRRNRWSGWRPGAYPCHGQHGTQGMVIDGGGMVRIPLLMYEHCLVAGDIGKPVALSPCDAHQATQRWSFSEGRLQQQGTMNCLAAASEKSDKLPFALTMAQCNNNEEQQWEWYI